ncbi:MAG: hypothetical protein QM765_10865 [Myxococcales bacterium]
MKSHPRKRFRKIFRVHIQCPMHEFPYRLKSLIFTCFAGDQSTKRDGIAYRKLQFALLFWKKSSCRPNSVTASFRAPPRTSGAARSEKAKSGDQKKLKEISKFGLTEQSETIDCTPRRERRDCKEAKVIEQATKKIERNFKIPS